MKRSGDRGQATVEFALIIPLIMVVLLAVMQVCLVGYNKLAVTQLARETARTLALDPDADIGHLIDDRVVSGPDGIVIEIHYAAAAFDGRETVTVLIRYQTPPVVGLFSPFSGYFDVDAKVQVLTERQS